MIANFGIRRGSSNDAGHAHIASELSLGTKDCREMAICNISYDEWIAILIEKGVVETTAPEADSTVKAGQVVRIDGVAEAAYVLYFNDKTSMYCCQWMEGDQSKSQEFGESDFDVA